MEISVTTYEEITGLPALPPPVDETDYERRRHRRVPFGQRAIISPERKGMDSAPTVVMLRDISASGVSFLHEEALKPGTRMVIEFKGHQDRAVKLRCAVARCESGGAGGTQFLIGSYFEELLTKELPPEQPIEIPKLVELAAPEMKLAQVMPVEAKLPETKPVKAIETETAPVNAVPVPPARALFAAAEPSPAKKADEYWAGDKPSETPPPPAAPKVVPEQAPVFRVVALPEPEPVLEKEIVIAPEPVQQSDENTAKTHEVLAQVKELLLKQEQTIESQRLELNEQREKFEKEVEGMRLELEDTKRNLAEFRAKSRADDTAVAELARFLEERAGSKSPMRKNEAA